MTSVQFCREAGAWIGFRADGHTGYAAHGEDIVCAAVSALTQTAVIGLEDTVGIQPLVAVKDGNLTCFLPKDLDPKTWQYCQIVLDTVYRGLQAIAQEYSQFVTVEEVESCG